MDSFWDKALRQREQAKYDRGRWMPLRFHDLDSSTGTSAYSSSSHSFDHDTSSPTASPPLFHVQAKAPPALTIDQLLPLLAEEQGKIRGYEREINVACRSIDAGVRRLDALRTILSKNLATLCKDCVALKINFVGTYQESAAGHSCTVCGQALVGFTDTHHQALKSTVTAAESNLKMMRRDLQVVERKKRAAHGEMYSIEKKIEFMREVELKKAQEELRKCEEERRKVTEKLRKLQEPLQGTSFRKKAGETKAVVSSMDESALCLICAEEPKAIAFVPCGHVVCCDKDAKGLTTCPLCRKRIEGNLKVFL